MDHDLFKLDARRWVRKKHSLEEIPALRYKYEGDNRHGEGLKVARYRQEIDVMRELPTH